MMAANVQQRIIMDRNGGIGIDAYSAPIDHLEEWTDQGPFFDREIMELHFIQWIPGDADGTGSAEQEAMESAFA